MQQLGRQLGTGIVPGQGKSRNIQSLLKLFDNFINRKFISLQKNRWAGQLEHQKLLQPGKDQILPSAVHGGWGVQKVTPRTKSPRQRVREAHNWDGNAVFRLHSSTQDDMLLFGDVKCLRFHEAWTKHLK
jgi:hypothetical protein